MKRYFSHSCNQKHSLEYRTFNRTYFIYKNEDNMKGTHLGELEELVLLSVAAIRGNAYAVTVKAGLEDKADRKINISAIHSCLYRLEDKGFLDSEVGGATNKRGGKGKRLFKVTAYGLKALKEAQEVRQSFWDIIPQLATNK
ncbi:MAG TPA: PadR family transcriptional regulator [Roseivirga sp.]